MRVFKHFTNGIAIIIFSVMHTQFAYSSDGFGTQLGKFAKSGFFYLSKGMAEMPAKQGVTDFESGMAIWFFYWGILVFPIGILVHVIERKYKVIPQSFTVVYLLVILFGSYMIPASGMTFFMLPHAFFMLVSNYIKSKRRLKFDNNYYIAILISSLICETFD